MRKLPWSNSDRQRFKDRNILKAKTVPSKRKSPPDESEWKDEKKDHS